MRLLPTIGGPVLAVATAALVGRAAPPDVKVDAVVFGKAIQGPQLTAKDLKGRVAVVDFCSAGAPPYAVILPRLARLDDELGDFGLVVVGVQSQAATPEEVRAKAAGFGVRYPIAAGGGVTGVTIDTIPRTFVFDHSGKCVFDGHPAEAEAKARAALGEALIAAAGRESFPKGMSGHLDALRKGQNPAAVLAKLAPLQKSVDKDTAEAAKALAGAILATGQQRLDATAAAAEKSPIEAFDAATRLAATLKGTPVGTRANELAAKLRPDKAVQAELKARPVLEQVKALDAALAAAAQNKVDPGSEAFRKAFAPQLKQLTGLNQQMKRNWPDAPATAAAAAVAEKYGVK
jgi:hypothetical protein